MTDKNSQSKQVVRSPRPWEQVTVPDNMRARVAFPTIQWINRGNDVKPAQDRGGFFCAVKFGGVQLPGGVQARYHKDEGMFSHSLELAVLALRTGWFVKSGEINVRVARYQEGARRRVEALALLKAPDGEAIGPVKVTVVGLANAAIPEAHRALTATATGAGAQPWMFWTQWNASQPEEVGPHKVEMTPVAVGVPTVDQLADAFIGVEAVQKATALAAEIETWGDAWGEVPEDEALNGDTEGETPESVADTFAQAQAQVVVTQKYGRSTFGELMRQDAAYTTNLLGFIVANPDRYAPEQVEAARLLLSRLPKQPADEPAF